jgi:hypothetical protein
LAGPRYQAPKVSQQNADAQTPKVSAQYTDMPSVAGRAAAATAMLAPPRPPPAAADAASAPAFAAPLAAAGYADMPNAAGRVARGGVDVVVGRGGALVWSRAVKKSGFTCCPLQSYTSASLPDSGVSELGGGERRRTLAQELTKHTRKRGDQPRNGAGVRSDGLRQEENVNSPDCRQSEGAGFVSLAAVATTRQTCICLLEPREGTRTTWAGTRGRTTTSARAIESVSDAGTRGSHT